jgi:hypothetical protein
VQELPQDLDESHLKPVKPTLNWTIALAGLSVPALANQVAKLKFIELRLQAILLLLSWTVLAVFVLLSRPRSCPSSLLAYYLSALFVESSSIRVWDFPPKQEEAVHYVAILATLASIAIILVPMRPASMKSASISSVGTTPNSKQRSPEDDLRLWQFLCVSWISPLMAIGKKRQLQEEDVWLLGFEFQHKRLNETFRQLRGSVFARLFQANGIDCCILILIALIRLICGKYSKSVR